LCAPDAIRAGSPAREAQRRKRPQAARARRRVRRGSGSWRPGSQPARPARDCPRGRTGSAATKPLQQTPDRERTLAARQPGRDRFTGRSRRASERERPRRNPGPGHDCPGHGCPGHGLSWHGLPWHSPNGTGDGRSQLGARGGSALCRDRTRGRARRTSRPCLPVPAQERLHEGPLLGGLLGEQGQLVGVEWTRCHRHRDRRTGVGRGTAQLGECDVLLVDRHDRTSGAAVGTESLPAAPNDSQPSVPRNGTNGLPGFAVRTMRKWCSGAPPGEGRRAGELSHRPASSQPLGERDPAGRAVRRGAA